MELFINLNNIINDDHIKTNWNFPSKGNYKKIDIERQDIPRSKYLLRIIEKLFQKKETKSNNDSLDTRSLKRVSSESIMGGQ